MYRLARAIRIKGNEEKEEEVAACVEDVSASECKQGSKTEASADSCFRVVTTLALVELLDSTSLHSLPSALIGLVLDYAHPRLSSVPSYLVRFKSRTRSVLAESPRFAIFCEGDAYEASCTSAACDYIVSVYDLGRLEACAPEVGKHRDEWLDRVNHLLVDADPCGRYTCSSSCSLVNMGYCASGAPGLPRPTFSPRPTISPEEAMLEWQPPEWTDESFTPGLPKTLDAQLTTLKLQHGAPPGAGIQDSIQLDWTAVQAADAEREAKARAAEEAKMKCLGATKVELCHNSAWFRRHALCVLKLAALYGGRAFGGYVRDIVVGGASKFNDLDIKFESMAHIQAFLDAKNSDHFVVDYKTSIGGALGAPHHDQDEHYVGVSGFRLHVRSPANTSLYYKVDLVTFVAEEGCTMCNDFEVNALATSDGVRVDWIDPSVAASMRKPAAQVVAEYRSGVMRAFPEFVDRMRSKERRVAMSALRRLQRFCISSRSFKYRRADSASETKTTAAHGDARNAEHDASSTVGEIAFPPHMRFSEAEYRELLDANTHIDHDVLLAD